MKNNKIIIKIGTNVMTKNNSLLDKKIIENIVKQIVKIKNKKTDVIIISSGAVGAGKSIMKLDKNTDKTIRRQTLSAVGQIKLMQVYSKIFKKYNISCAQVLWTKEDFRDKEHYANMKNCFEGLLSNNIIPIINENDVVAITELMFTDNDELAGLITKMLGSKKLIILSNIDGLMDMKTKKVIKKINSDNNWKKFITDKKSKSGRGGMKTKCTIAQKLASTGITCHIINGKTNNSILKVFRNEDIGTTFLADAN